MGTPTYWPTDPGKVPALLDFVVISGISQSYMEIESNLDLSSDHTPMITTISTTIMAVKKIPKLHITKTNWQEYRNISDDQINLNISSKNPEEIEEGLGKLIYILQEAARQATPPPEKKKTMKNLPYEIKKFII
jgi:hypothetical protein